MQDNGFCMDIEVDEHGRTVIKTDNIQELLEYLKSRDKREIEAFRPVLVVSIGDPDLNGGQHNPQYDYGAAIVETLALVGYRPEQASFTDLSSESYSFDFKKKATWPDLPCLSEPEISLSHHMLRQFDSTGRCATDQKRLVGVHVDNVKSYTDVVRDNVKVLVVASNDLTDSHIVKALDHWEGVATEELPIVVHHGPDGGAIVSKDRLQFARERFLAEQRFLYNHAMNFSEIARRTLFKIYFDERLAKETARSALPWIGELRWRWAHPFLLQLLHLLKRLGRIGTDEDRVNLQRSVSGFIYAPIYAKGLPVFEKVESGYDFVWTGSGKYPEYRLPLGMVPDHGDYDPDSYSTLWPHRFFSTFQHIEHVGLLGLNGDDIVLTPWGLKFLEIIGSESEDPDVLLRWRTELGEIGGSDDIADMDGWIVKTFEGSKRRINEFQDVIELFDDATYLKGCPVSNQLSILGRYLPLSETDLANPGIQREIQTVQAAEHGIELKDRNCGLILEAERMGAERRILGVWIGVGLAVSSLDEMAREPGWLKNLDALENEANAALQVVPPYLRALAEKHPVSVVHGLITPESRGVLRELSWRIEADEKDILRPIILGVVSTIDKTATHSKSLSVSLMINDTSEAVPAPNYYDGIGHYHGKGTNTVTTTCGYFVGIYNETRETYVIDRELNSARINGFEMRKEGMMGNLARYFDVNRSTHGYWAILSDGSARQINLRLQS